MVKEWLASDARDALLTVAIYVGAVTMKQGGYHGSQLYGLEWEGHCS